MDDAGAHMIEFVLRLLVGQEREPSSRARHRPGIGPNPRRCLGGCRRPWPLIRTHNELCAYWISLDIAKKAIDRRFIERQDRAIAALEDRASTGRPSARVKPPRQHGAEPVHEARQITIGSRPDHQVVVIRHHAARQNPHAELRARLLQRAREDAIVGGARDEQLPLRRPVHHVNDLPACRKPRWLRHGRSLRDRRTEFRRRPCIKMRSTPARSWLGRGDRRS
jgi:hypothetical protein